jgi:hypothetical protein
MFFQLLFIHLYRPFLKYTRNTSPLPSYVSPRKFCTQAAAAISKLLRLYKRTHGLRQICNIAVYIAHSACTIHILNLPDKNAKRDIIHGVKHLEEIGECWTCARRTLRMLSMSASKWKIGMPDEAEATFTRTAAKWGVIDFSASPVGGFPDLSPQSQSASQNSSAPPPHDLNHPPINAQQPPNTQSSMSPGYGGILPGVAPSPPPTTTSEGRRSWGEMSLPPQSASDLIGGTNKGRPSTYLTHLTQAQQDAWNRHQAAQTGSNTHSGGSSTDTASNANTAILFGRVGSLVEESQDWWLKDQSVLALGFDNWIDGGTDWARLGLGSNFGGGGGSSSIWNQVHGNDANTTSPVMDSNGPSYTYPSKSGNGFMPYDTASGAGLNGGTAYRYGPQDGMDEEMLF